ncbi:unnamed protein product [Cyprideis torosa]|uniref:Bis(5'-nucleosyl)-tetraphosphatase [asymmetrical] n=1 Tax=Cyprideis torosa TaxID=163714 RepID=A0A7R8WN12_9CRUS|nr:unnamed protein product [Cyprideis torosa]CAG0905739.1 unnamed protein product [Cyprideis torosa]
MSSSSSVAGVVRAAGLVVFRRSSSALTSASSSGSGSSINSVQSAKKVEYLLLQTSYGEHHWTPPKGHVDPGEDDRTTALRETMEEAGLGPNVLKILEGFSSTLKYLVKGKPKEVIYWLAELILPSAEVKLSDEHQAFKWLSLEDALSLSPWPEQQKLLKDCEAFLAA